MIIIIIFVFFFSHEMRLNCHFHTCIQFVYMLGCQPVYTWTELWNQFHWQPCQYENHLCLPIMEKHKKYVFSRNLSWVVKITKARHQLTCYLPVRRWNVISRLMCVSQKTSRVPYIVSLAHHHLYHRTGNIPLLICVFYKGDANNHIGKQLWQCLFTISPNWSG